MRALLVTTLSLSLVAMSGRAFAQDNSPSPDVKKADDAKPANATKKKKDKKREKVEGTELAQNAPASPPPASGAKTPPAATPPPGPNQPPPGIAGGPPPAEIPGEENELYHCKKYSPSVKIKVTLKPDTDLKDLVAWVMGYTCKSFIYGNAISGRAAKVTIIAPAEMTPPEAYRLFLVALQTMSLTVVPKGNTMEIVESQRGRELPVPVYRSKDVPAVDQVVRVLLRPEHISADDLSQVLNAMKTSSGVVTPIANAGVVIITDYGSSIDRMLDVLKDVDEASGGEKIYIIPLSYTDATDMAAKLSDIFGIGKGGTTAPAQAQQPRPGQPAGAPMPAAGGGATSERGGSAVPSRIIADQRTNALIVIASERAYQRVHALIQRLEALAGGGEGEAGTIHVYNLANADAEELAGVLNALITGTAQRSTAAGGSTQGRPGGAPGATAPVSAPGVQQTGSAFEGAIKLTHDKTTNSLVIVSSAKDYVALRDVIKKLDIPRMQVYVEATIFEVALSTARNMGVSYHAGDTFSLQNQGDSVWFGGVEASAFNSLSIDPANLVGLVGGIRGPQISGFNIIPGVSIPSIGVMFQLYQQNSDVNVLSSPNLLTTDNQPAEFTVGQNIPYQAGIGGIGGLPSTSTTGAAGATAGLGAFPLQSISRQDVALTLKMTPHVNQSDYVRLELDQEISDILDPNFSGLGPSWSKRQVKTTVVVKDQQSVVIGGLISEKETVDESKVPVLGDIPILGYLFKYTKRQKQRNNLLIILTPYIIKDQADLQRIFERKMRERRQFMDTYTQFEAKESEPDIDYHRKRGLLEEINKAVITADDDERLLEESQRLKVKREEGAVDLDAVPVTNAPSTTPPPTIPATPIKNSSGKVH